ncbi:MAG: substrate-binding domain-containing protein [Alphaproteobacteria bacterium]|nr:substrate-binding domain-containing protein [Alphaproteobacteria bacterium]MBO6861970.1 substrate-binding domain-containing protein [Alphaproteobacteria bacterium]
MLKHILTRLALAALLVAGGLQNAQAAERFITVASTTSTANSGLFDHILPLFTGKTGIEVRVVAVGTGQAIKLARNGDADVLFVHHKPSEEAFVADGFGVERVDVMYNDFVIVGPSDDPAGIMASSDVLQALNTIAKSGVPFASRGDDSGTHKRERSLWKEAGIDSPSGDWYRETGSGMGATLNTAHGMGAYALTDRATWLSFKNKDGFEIVFEGDKRMFNQYGIIAVSPDKFPHVKIDDATAFVNWVVSKDGQAAIADYTVGGTQLFFPNAPMQGS